MRREQVKEGISEPNVPLMPPRGSTSLLMQCLEMQRDSLAMMEISEIELAMSSSCARLVREAEGCDADVESSSECEKSDAESVAEEDPPPPAASGRSLQYCKPSELDIEILLESIVDSIPRRLDQYNDGYYAVPFCIQSETFPVPASIGGDRWCPGEPLRVSYITWNMAHLKPQYCDVSDHCIRRNAHIVAVCTQGNGSNWINRRKQQQLWCDFVSTTCLLGRYELVGSCSLRYTQLLVFVRQEDVAPYVDIVEKSCVRSGIIHGLCGGKGGVGISLSLSMVPKLKECTSTTDCSAANTRWRDAVHRNKEHSSPHGNMQHTNKDVTLTTSCITLLFVGVHLPARHNAVEGKNKDYRNIMKTLRLGLRGEHKNFHEQLQQNRKLLHGAFNNYVNAVGDMCQSTGSFHGAHPTYGSFPSSRGRNVLSYFDSCDEKDEDSLAVMKLPPCTAYSAVRADRDVTDEFDAAFIGGDLNCRINGSMATIRHTITKQRNIRSILTFNDQLNIERSKGKILQGFKEGELLFRPTYKYKIMKRSYDLSEKDVPAYRDRVLFKKPPMSRAGKIKIKLYTDVQDVKSSDHRPVVALFDVGTVACTDSSV
uniref:Putative endonuclease/exonuclease/phosphatase n=1 Tax=Trypanosoma congolense (strain IL3000) TaxID=1068625 RepID=G0UWD5_TRYCI|nr:putative endonuclease/exonuclease/phosphatase [Trypanosoma congolense IL3000]